MTKLMILGAGIYQVPLIKKAKEMGLYTIVVSIPGNYPGFEIADKVYYENTTDVEAVVKIAEKEKIDGIVTTGTDVAMITIGTVCDRLNLKGVSADAARKSCSKALMKEVFVRNGIRCAKSHTIDIDTSIDDVHAKCEDIGYPVVVKAVDSSGSRGITIVKEKSQLQHAIDSVISVTRSNVYLVEECLCGEELGADAFVLDGEVKLVVPHGKYVYFAETGVPVGHYIPYENKAIADDICEQITKACKAMGYNNCAVNADIMLQDNKPYILEMGARAGATCIPELISLYQGYDYYEKMIEAAIGKDVDFERDDTKSMAGAAKLIISEKSGVVKNICLHDNENIVYKSIDVKPGDFVEKFRLGPHRIGHVVAAGKTVDEAEKKLVAIIDSITMEVESAI